VSPPCRPSGRSNRATSIEYSVSQRDRGHLVLQKEARPDRPGFSHKSGSHKSSSASVGGLPCRAGLLSCISARGAHLTARPRRLFRFAGALTRSDPACRSRRDLPGALAGAQVDLAARTASRNGSLADRYARTPLLDDDVASRLVVVHDEVVRPTMPDDQPHRCFRRAETRSVARFDGGRVGFLQAGAGLARPRGDAPRRAGSSPWPRDLPRSIGRRALWTLMFLGLHEVSEDGPLA
jgi:hypothetical protein